MNMKERMDALVAAVPEEKRKELLTKLLEAESNDERIAIAKSYLGDKADKDAPEWLSEAYELSDEDLEQVSGGTEMPWDNDVDEYGCS